MSTPGKIIHKYDIADFTNYYYWSLYFGADGVWEISGQEVTGEAGAVLDLMVSKTPIFVSGTDDLYLIGDIKPYLGPNKPTITVSATTATDYYYGNLGQGTGIDGQTGYFN